MVRRSVRARPDVAEQRRKATVESPALARRRLGAELRLLREAARVSLATAAAHLECSHAKISRLESGRGVAYARDVRDLLELYGAAPPKRRQLLALVDDSRRSSWLDDFSGLVPTGSALDRLVGLESGAEADFTYAQNLVPALLQTENYARAVFSSVAQLWSLVNIDSLVELRLRRRRVFQRNPPLRANIILDEAVVRRTVGDVAVMAEQLNHIIAMARDGLELGADVSVLPFSRPGHPGLEGSFRVLTFPNSSDRDIVVVESAADVIFLEGDETAKHYQETYHNILSLSERGTDAIAYLEAAKMWHKTGSDP
jgi:hypothetical protein